ncbi:ATP-grasp domain-containing protein [Vibrio diazotrophicus]|uniref:ATP-grasp domain-containing protein n=1 Tax=Vibrio diazotrophicus TaxID=685 RepID=UPI0005A730D6|nr:ATP-grasp domain-containing protein [Vibrio diazotrophicus]
MNSKNILVTGVGAIIGYGIVKSLKASNVKNINIIGMDVFNDAVGRHWCDSFVKCVYANSPEYPSFIENIIEDKKIDLIIPGIEQDVDALHLMILRGELSEKLVAINSSGALKVFRNKLRTSEIQEELGLDFIEYIDSASAKSSQDVIDKCGIPCIYKPYTSYAGKGLVLLDNKNKISELLEEKKGIFQRYINSDKEFTVSIFGVGDGNYLNPIAFERKLGPDGATHKAKVTDYLPFKEVIDSLVKYTKPVGPTNFQFILDLDKLKYLLLEVNPRISSSTSIRQKFGVNESQMCLEYYLFSRIPVVQSMKYGYAERYIDEVVTYDSDNI